MKKIKLVKKNFYIAIAVVVFLFIVALVIAQYDATKASHGTLYTDRIEPKSHSDNTIEVGATIDVLGLLINGQPSAGEGFIPADIDDTGWGNESNGEVTFPNGLQMKWGIVDPPKQNQYDVTFASQGLSDFNNACFQVFLTTAEMKSTVDSSHDRHTNAINLDKTGFSIYGSERLVNWRHRWFAIGR